MLELCKHDATVSDLLHKENGQKILEAFQKTETGNPVTPNEAELAMFLGGLKGEVLTTDVVRRLVALLGIQIKLNEVTWHVELSGYPKEWSRANAENLLPVRLLDHLRSAGAKGAAKNTIADCLDVIAEEKRFNPVLEMFTATQWDNADRVTELYDIWGVTDPLSQTLIRKWLLQCVAMRQRTESGDSPRRGFCWRPCPKDTGSPQIHRCSCQHRWSPGLYLRPVPSVQTRWGKPA